MTMIKPLAAAAVSAVMLALAGPALAAPAKAFECPATQAQAEALLSRLKEKGSEVVDEYGTRTRTFDATGYTVYGLPVFRLEVIADSYPEFDHVAFQAKTREPFDVARDAMFGASGRSACDNTNETISKICKLLGPRVGDIEIMRYVEVSRVDGINVGCQYTRDKQG